MFGINWNTVTNKSIAECFDQFDFNGSMLLLNRARLFMNELQLQFKLGWDTKISEDFLRRWRNIATQWNKSPHSIVKRLVGNRDHVYKLISLTDASQRIYGTTIFIHDMTDDTVSILTAKNRVVSRQLETKTIPSLEFEGIVLGAVTLLEVKMN